MNGAAMMALQEIDTALDVISNRRPRLPEVAAHKEASAAASAAAARRAAVEQRIAAAQAAIDGAEAAAHDLTTKRARLEGQLKTVISPREAEALMNQIAGLNAQRSDLDDQELAALEQQAEAEAELAELAVQMPALEDALAAATAALAAATAALDDEAADLRARREAAVAQLTATEIQGYDHGRRQHGGVAVARLDGHRCNGCHLDLSPAEMDIVKATPAGDLAECPQCARYLIR